MAGLGSEELMLDGSYGHQAAGLGLKYNQSARTSRAEICGMTDASQKQTCDHIHFDSAIL